MTDDRMGWDRERRSGTAGAVFCPGKSDRHIALIVGEAARLSGDSF